MNKIQSAILILIAAMVFLLPNAAFAQQLIPDSTHAKSGNESSHALKPEKNDDAHEKERKYGDDKHRKDDKHDKDNRHDDDKYDDDKYDDDKYEKEDMDDRYDD